MIRIEKIMSLLETEYVGREIHYFQKLSSTNTVAKEQAEKGAKEGTTIVAEVQTQGRGRLSRPWVSPKGGVWLSIILRPKVKAEDALKITLTTAVAVAKTLRSLYGWKAEIKWPNDVLIRKKKVCGILTEASLNGKTVNFLVVGIGLNANFALKSLSENLQKTATTLKEVLKKNVDIEKLICTLLKEFEDCYKLFKEGKFVKLLSEWCQMAGFLGKKVEITSFMERWVGKAVDIDENGALIVELENGERKKVLSGDVTIQGA
jgi:BirA family biotin operon repressor/biotin-[acetyl-CoA-carboxylase] ligase